jgi:DNA-binding transcriptional ArsR family regulator
MYNPAHPIFGIIRSSQKIRLSGVEDLGRKAGSAPRVLEWLRKHPMANIPKMTAKLGLPPPTVSSAVECLEVLGIVREITGKRRDRIYVYDRYARILDEGTEPLPR